ncbi:hypothetical protein BU25DRAFT_485706, partial [Macroventuria anomochaeta]
TLAWAKPRDENQRRYQHNRRLELHKSVQRGSRLGLVRFSGCGLSYPPHTPEMDELGLWEDAYEALVARIDQISLGFKAITRSPYVRASCMLNRLCNRGSNDIVSKLRVHSRTQCCATAYHLDDGGNS